MLSIKKISKIGFTISAIVYIFLHFIDLLIDSPVLLDPLAVFGFFALVFALILLTRKGLPLFLVTLAIMISIIGPEINVLEAYLQGFREMRALLPMLFIIPFVGWVLEQENYVEDTIILLKKRLKNSKIFYFILMFITQIISFFLLFGSVVVVYQIIQTFFAEKKTQAWELFKSTSVLRGFSLATIWVISIPSFAYGVEVLKAPLISAFFQGFFLSIAGIFLAVIFLTIFEKKENVSFSREIREAIEEAAVEADQNDQKTGYRNPLEFAFLFFSLLGLTLIVNALVPIGLLTVIPMVVLVWVLAYFIIKRRPRAFLSEMKRYVTDGIAKNSQQWGLLLSVGLIIAVLNDSGLSKVFMETIYHWTEEVIGINFLIILPLIVLCFSFIGVGPLSVMVLMAGIIQSIYLPYPPELIVLAMTLGSMMSVLLSPLILPSILLSSLNQRSAFQNSFKQNWKFAIAFYVVAEIYMQIRILF